MVNLEVWLSPGFDFEKWTSVAEIENCGPLGPIGRAGWYVPEWMISNQTNNILDHWRAFQQTDVTEKFNLKSSDDLLNNIKSNSTQYYCQLTECDNGIYVPNQCRGDKICATLLADLPSNNFEYLKRDIERYSLLVEVAWVGPNLDRIVLDRTNRRKPVLFFNWKPNTLTYRDQFINVAFPHCEDTTKKETSTKFSGDCEFEINQMQKVVWRTIKTKAPDIYYVLRRLYIDQATYVGFLKRYQEYQDKIKPLPEGDDIPYLIACEWVNDVNDELWHHWIPPDLEVEYKLLIGGIFPLSGSMRMQRNLAEAAKLAVANINRNDNILPSNVSLNLDVADGKCLPDVVMKKFIDYVSNMSQHKQQLVGILGPACSDSVEPIAGLSKHFNTVIISYSAEGARFNDRNKYPYFFRTIPENRLFEDVYLALFEMFDWNRVASMTEDRQTYPEYISHLESQMLQKPGKIFLNERFSYENTSEVERCLKNIEKQNFKIIIADFFDHSAREVMCKAYKKNMTASNGYLWFLPLWYDTNWYDTDRYNTNKDYQHNISCTTAQMKEVIQGHFSLTYKFYADKNDRMQTNDTVGEWVQFYRKFLEAQKADDGAHTASSYIFTQDNSTVPGDELVKNDNSTDWDEELLNKEISNYGGYAYDAVWVYAYALGKLLREDYKNYHNLHTEKVAKRYIQLLKETDFNGVSGHIQFEGSSRPSGIIIWERVNGKVRKIGTYSEKNLTLYFPDIVWYTPNKQPPYDGTQTHESGHCIFDGLAKALKVSCDTAVIIVNLLVFTAVIVLVICIFLLYKRRYDTKFKKTEARFRELGLLSGGGMFALDEWEMPRDHIVINRKLGEGAFGTVYGGEAQIEDKGWLAVAVKTLKVTANDEEKMDFLSEAQMMKRFEHGNIVRLIGVCTKGDPVYTVMEFMLYGDLKTYLLARRQLVKEPDTDASDEVSIRQLTKMCLDITRGLSYLAEQKYVHRDLACRNCLINVNRTVKIGDFGMCRMMYDKDYYRFNKHGMLPVRWMAPESLSDGLFTPMTDIWSFGVLLYEIITFGSFPYQGLSNNQVVEHVTNFHTLTVPKGCKPELEALLIRCWSREAVHRPAAFEIVEILAQDPELISPCLDVPMASVEVQDSDPIELTIHDRSRIHSVASLGHMTPSASAVHQRRNRSPILNESTTPNGLPDLSNGSLVHSDSSPTALHTRLLPNKGQYVTLHSRDSQDLTSTNLPKDGNMGIASL